MRSKPNHPTFSIIIPNLNGAKFLPNCLNSLLSSLKLAKIKNFEIILVDNASTDNSIQTFETIITNTPSVIPSEVEGSLSLSQNSRKARNLNKSRDSSIPLRSTRNDISYQIIQNSSNFGFAKAVNQGILKAKYNHVIICNNDLTIDKNWFKHISTAIKINKDSKVTTFFGTVLNKNGTKIESRGLKFFISGKALNIDNGKPVILSANEESRRNQSQQKDSSTSSQNDASYFVWGSSASIVCYHKATLLKIGMFDPDFFAYEEDVDLALRLHNLKYKTFFVPQAISYHIGGSTSKKMGNFRNRMDAKNWFYIIIKNYSKKEILNNLFPIIIERLRNLSGLIKQTIKIYKLKSVYILPTSLITTYGQIILNLPKMLKKRKNILKYK
ncbi:glycosyltransferase [Patescibacteria group bacterium]|nr:glycosyltransferase [Patescibacteria group bacterium]